MKTRLLSRTVLTLSFLLLVRVENTRGQAKSIQGDDVSRVVKQVQKPKQTDAADHYRALPPSGIQSQKKQPGLRFDQLQFEQQVSKLKRISEQRTLMKNLNEAVQKAESEKAIRQALDLQKQTRLKLFGKTTRFYQAPVPPKPTLSQLPKSTSSTLVSNVLINGKTQDSIYVGEQFTLTFSFAPNTPSAIVTVYLDADNNGLVSADDILLANALFLDNDDNDENFGTGDYKVTFGKNDILGRLVSSMIFEVNDYQSVSSAVLTVRQQPTTSAVLGSVFPARPSIACRISSYASFQIVFTDTAGKFSFYVDRQQTSQVTIYPIDLTGVTNGSIPPQNTILQIVSDTTNATITYSEAKSFIEGYVKDHTGGAISNASVYTYGSYFEVRTKSDSSGYFKLGVSPGYWNLYASIPWTADYLRKSYYSNSIYVGPNATVQYDLSFVKSNNTISGKVSFNTVGAGGIPITTYADSIYNYVLSSGDGTYAIPVFKPSTGTKYYTVNCFSSQGYFVENSPQMNIQPGATNVNFAVKKVAGGLQGRITDINTGNGIPDAYISVSGPTYKSVYSNDSGYYRMSLLDGTYSINVGANHYFYYSDYNIVISGAVLTKNISLQRSGTFSGTVKDVDAKPIPYAYVMAYDSSGTWQLNSRYPDFQGKYIVSGLNTAKYKAAVTANGYIMQWYDKASSAQNATAFQVIQGFDTPNIDFVLSRGGSISGRIIDRSGNPIAGVWVTVFDTSFYGRSNATTNDSGIYTASGLATGKYLVQAYSYLYFQQWYDGVSTFDKATRVDVVIDQNTPNINFTLSKGGSISGTVKSKSDSAILYAYVTLLDSAFYSVAYGNTNDSGYYLISRLEPGKKFYVVAGASGYARRWYNNVSTPDSATLIVFQPEEVKENVNFVLPLAGSITGRVWDDLGNPVPYASVYVHDSLGYYYGYGDQNGNYSVTNLSTGKYYVYASAYGYVEQWFDHKATMQLADKVSVIEEKVTPNINFDLHRLSGITGTVVDDSSGLGLSSILIRVIRTSDGLFGNSSYTNYDGTYFILLPPDNYVLTAEAVYGTDYLRKYYTSSGGTPLLNEAQTITVVEGQPPRVLNFRLERRKDFYAFTQEKLGMTITNHGQLGYWQVPNLPSGRWPLPSSPNYLFEGDIWIGGESYNPWNVLVRNVVGGMYQGIYGEWAPAWNFTVQSSADPKKVETFYTSRPGNDSLSYNFPGLVVRQRSYSWPNTDYAIYKYTILYGPSYGSLPNIQNAYIGFFMDFDISANATNDMVGIDKNSNLVYMYNSSAPDGVTMGVSLLSGSATRLTWWRSSNDPKTDSLRYGRMIADTSTALPTTPDDCRAFVSVGPFNLIAGDSVTVAIAVVAGNGAAGVINAAKQAQAAFPTTAVEDLLGPSIPENFVLYQNYPNPFNPATTIRFAVGASEFVSLKIYDILGREIRVLVNEELRPGNYRTTWDASGFGSGMYFYRLHTGSFSETKKMLLLK